MKKLALGTAAAAVLVAVMVGVAAAGPNTKAPLLSEFIPDGNYDNAGPEGFGFVNSNQNGNGELRVVVSLKNAAPKAGYSVELWCGPTHAQSGAQFYASSLKTNVQGAANTAAIRIPVSTLRSFCGTGAKIGHVDLDGSENSFVTNGGIPYTVR